MTRAITQRELRNDSGQVLRDVEAGETLIITRHGTPVAELRPVARVRTASRESLLSAVRTLPHIDVRQWRADLDAVIDPWFDGE